MVRTARLLLILAFLAGTSRARNSQAQTLEQAPTPSVVTSTQTEPEFLRTLPRPPDAPASLMTPAAPLGPPPPDLERPYFQIDPLLDPPQLGRVGWFADVDVSILKPHLKNQLTNTVTFGDGSTTAVGLPAATLNWTASPRFEIGYRLPSGFGALSMSYRFMNSQGAVGALGPDGPATLSSRLATNLADFDWSSREYTPWTLCDMRVHFGLRYVALYFDSLAAESFAEAAAGSGIFSSRTTNSFVGIGPNAGVDLYRRLNYGGLALFASFNASSSFGRIRQGFFASSTAPGADGQPQNGVFHVSSSGIVPIVTSRLGIDWQPPALPAVHLSAGFQYEYWWNAGRLSATESFGDFFDSGAFLRAEYNF